MKSIIVSAEEAVALVHDGNTICCNGFVQSGIPEALLEALEKRFLKTDHPKNLRLFAAAGRINENVADNLAEMDRYMLDQYWTNITRYATSAFMRMKLDQAFSQRNIAPHVFERKEEAQAFLISGN